METQDPTPLRPSSPEVKMVLKDGLLVPADTVAPPCNHADVAIRVQKNLQQRDQYHCKGCDEKVQVAFLNFLIGKPEELDAVLAQIAAAQQQQQQAMRRKQSGLVLPGEPNGKAPA